MSKDLIGGKEISFFRKMTAMGALFLIIISISNYFFPTEIADEPVLRLILAAMAFSLFLGSFWSKAIVDRADFLLALLINIHALLMVWVNFKNNFEIFETSTSLVVGFALGAAFRKKEGLLTYLSVLFGAYCLSFFYALNPLIPTDYFFITLSLLIGLAWMVFASRISALNASEKHREELIKSEAFFRDVFEWTPVGAMLLDMDFKVMKANKVIQEHTGYNQSEFVGKPFQELLLATDDSSIESFLNELSQSLRNKCTLEERFITRDGEKIWVRINLARMTSNQYGEHIMAIIEDITFQKKASQKLRESAKKLEVHNKALEDFSYVVSHDLQEPLRMIKSYTQIINRRYIEKLHNEEAKKDMYYVIDGAERMSTLVRDMLSYTRVSAKPLEKEKVQTTDVVYDVLKNLTISIKERNAAVFIDELPSIQSNRMLFGQVMQNLLGNGLKYCSVERAPKIEVSAKQKNEETVFCVKDNGVGFTEEQGKKIFGIFQRINTTSAREKGTGIGLAICSRIIEKHGGKIWAEGAPDVGARFYFTLPNN